LKNLTWNKNTDGPNKEKLRIYQNLKKDGRKEEAKEFADYYILRKNPLHVRAARIEQGEAEHKEGIE